MIVLAACYDAPDYRTSSFKCDASHGCPTDQTCLAGVCAYVASTYDGVQCGDGPCGVGAQAAKPECCYDGTTSYCLATTDTCTGMVRSLAALCDGASDCPAGTACCPGSFGVAMCTPDPCDDRICQTSDDCGSYHYCCPDIKLPGAPFERCQMLQCGL